MYVYVAISGVNPKFFLRRFAVCQARRLVHGRHSDEAQAYRGATQHGLGLQSSLGSQTVYKTKGTRAHTQRELI